MSIQQQFQAATSDSGFFQEPVELSNVYLSDPILKDLLLRYLPYEQYKFIEKDLIELGDKVINKVIKLGELSEYNLPSIKQYDHWGRRIDELNVHPAWTELQQLGCEEGLVSIPYELPIGDLSRLYQFSKIYLFTPGNMADCPLSMTDGMSRVITNLGTKKQKQEILTHLITRNKCNFYSAGQWMTERKGGSDVSGTETIAYQKEGQWFIDGFKWFSSATDAKVTLLLARVVDENGNGKEGSRGLSLFLAKVRDDNGKLNGVSRIRIERYES
ncbi:hypothetical protein K502DRAFT_118360 [Neoconidiobolus thromboides FSU 785]|nr:hypothetical protein K502DRAFT_118360 [Neoconidiobolus thromboides FSU 785]